MAGVTRTGSERLVNTQTSGAQSDAAIAGLGSGGHVIVWADFSRSSEDTSRAALKARFYDADGRPLGAEVQVNTQTLDNQWRAEVTRLEGGGCVIVWQDESETLGDASGASIKAQLFTDQGVRLGGEFLVNASTAADQLAPQVAGLADGGFVVTWTDLSHAGGDASGSGVKARLFDSAGRAMGGDFVVNSQTAASQSKPAVSALAGGGFAVTWADDSHTLGDSNASSVKLQLFTSRGTRLGGEQLVNTATQGDQTEPRLTSLAGSGFVVTWRDSSGTLGDASGTSVKGQVFDAAGQRVGGEFLVNTQTAGNQWHADVEALAHGGFVVTWEDMSGAEAESNSIGIKAQQFDALGHRIGGEFRVNSQSAGDQTGPVVAALAGNGLAVSWTDTSQTLGDADFTAIRQQVLVLDPAAPFDFGANQLDFAALTEQQRASLDAQATHDTGLLYRAQGGDDVVVLPGLAGTALTAAITWDHSHAFDAGTGNDTVTGGDGGDFILGGFGMDALHGGTGRDRLAGGAGNDTLAGGEGNDRLLGQLGDDRLEGGTGNDRLEGRAGRDTLDGGSGHDVLIGGTGSDTLTGGAGRDLFRFENLLDSRNGGSGGSARSDIITDFEHGLDRIDLRLIDADSRTRGDQAFTLVDHAAFSGHAGELRWFRSADQAMTYVQFDVDGDHKADFTLQLIGKLTLNAADFLL